MGFIGKKGPGVTEGVPLFTEDTRATSMAHSFERHRRYEGLKVRLPGLKVLARTCDAELPQPPFLKVSLYLPRNAGRV